MGKVKSKRCSWRKTIGILLGIALILTGGRYLGKSYHLGNAIKNKTQSIVMNRVIKNKDKLEKAIEVLRETETEFIHINTDNEMATSYRSLDNNEITDVFKSFRLMAIVNDAKKEDSYSVKFYIYPDLCRYILDGEYEFGFYYSEEDKPLDYWREVRDETFAGECGEWGFSGTYTYKTTKIADNWWYFEEEIEFYKSYRRR